MAHLKHYIGIFCIIVLLAFLFDAMGIRICLFYALFHLPCPGCGMTRAAKSLLRGDIGKALDYNVMIFPLVMVCLFGCFFLRCEKAEQWKTMLQQRKRLFIGMSVGLTLVIWWINLGNPLLYESFS